MEARFPKHSKFNLTILIGLIILSISIAKASSYDDSSYGIVSRNSDSC